MDAPRPQRAWEGAQSLRSSTSECHSLREGLFPGRRGLDAFDHHGTRPAMLEDFPRDRRFLPGEFYQARVLSCGWHGIRDRPVDDPIISQNHKRGAGFCAREGAFGAHGLLKALDKCAGRVEHIAPHGPRIYMTTDG